MEKDKEAADDFADNHGGLVSYGGLGMNAKQLLGAICAMIVKVALAALIIVAVFRLAVFAYDFGYQVFVDLPVAEGEGRTVSVTVSEGQSDMELAKMLEEQGLIRDAKVFFVVMLLSKDRDEDVLKPGVYELSTAMNSEEMYEVFYNSKNEEEEE